MGNSVSRPGCLGQRSRRPEEPMGSDGAGGTRPQSGKGPAENGWSAAGPRRSPALKRSLSEAAVQDGSAACVALRARGEEGAAAWTPPRAPRGPWPSWQPVSAREVTEVTEVTETIVTEIVEVTQYPAGGDAAARTVTAALTDGTHGPEVTPQAVATIPEDSERAQDSPEALLAWVADMEELVGNQRPPAADVKVAKAQLEEQKLLRRLLEERRPRVERGLQDRPESAELRQRWGRLLEDVEERFVFLQRIVPAAQRFQQAADAFQDWLAATERLLAQLWGTDGCSGRLREAHQQGQTLCEELRARLPELQAVLECGQGVLQMVTGEEAALAQERLEWLRMRYVMAAQSSADTEQRMAQALEASSRGGPAQEDLRLWLGRMEAELNAWDGREPPCSDREKLQQFLRSELDLLVGLQERLDVACEVQLEAQALDVQLAEHKLLSAEILQHRGLAERLLSVAEPLLRCCPEPLRQRTEPSVQALRECMELLRQRSGARTVQLEQAQALLAQFCEAQAELQPWLEEAQAAAAQLCPDAVDCNAFREQQALLQCLREAVAEHRPLVTKLQRVAAQLQELSPEQAAPLQRRCVEAEEQYGRIRQRMQRAAALLEDALPRYGQLSERMDLLRECMERLQGRLQGCPPLLGDAAQLRERLRENGVAVAELQQMGAALQAVRAQCDELRDSMRAAGCDAAATALQAQAAQLHSQWVSLRGDAEAAQLRLQELHALAERFWAGAAELALSLAETQRLLLRMEGGGEEPDGVRARLQAVQALREELDALQDELQGLRCVGEQLMEACGDAAVGSVSKGVEELCSSWHSLNKVWAQLCGRLQDQLHHALAYRDGMERLLQWLDAAELRVADEFLIGADPDVLQQQLHHLKAFRRELSQSRVEAECLQPPGGRAAGQPPPQLLDFRRRWDHLEEEIVGRQHQLEAALLGLGQFQEQLAALLQWLSHTAEQLRGSTAPCSDLQSCEVEMAKHRVLQNDVQSHACSVRSVSDAGQGLLQCGAGDGAERLRQSLRELQELWEGVCNECERRQLQLQQSLGSVQDVTAQLTELLQWLESVEMQLCCCRAQGGDPDSAKEELDAHLELCRALDSKLSEYRSVREQLQRLQSCGPTAQPCSTEHRLRLLEQKWESVQEEAQERKQRLSEALSLSTELHGAVQELQLWLQRTERLLSGPTAHGVRMHSVTAQILQQQALHSEAAAHWGRLGALEAAAQRLAGLSCGRGGAGPGGTVRAVRERLRAVRERLDERGEELRAARKRCEEFWEAQQLLLQWLQDAELSLQESQGCAGGSREETKQRLEEHKRFQRTLRSKRPLLEAALRCGRALLDTELQQEEMQQLQEMLQEMKGRWEELCSNSAERLHALEQSVVLRGRLSDALQALLDWLYRAEPQLCQEAPVGGDRELVSSLMDKHKVFQKELGKRAGCMKMLKHSVRELTRSSSSSSSGGGGGADAQWLQQQMEELSGRWEAVCAMSVCKQGRLEAALQQAEELHALLQSFLGRLSEAEKSLKCGAGNHEEQRGLQDGLQHMQELLQSLQCQQLELECITSLGEEILAECHPDAVVTIRSCLSLADGRFREVRSRVEQHEERLLAQRRHLEAEREELQRLQLWVAAAEEALRERDGEPLPDGVEPLRELSRQHEEFMEELSRKQDDVDKATKGCREEPGEELSAATARRGAARRRSSPKAAMHPAVPSDAAEPQPAVAAQLLQRWQQLWLAALERQYRLETAMQRLQELEAFSRFDVAQWRRRFLRWIAQSKSRALDVFRSIDRDQDGRVSITEFIDSLLGSKFPTNALEMAAVANVFDTNGDGFIDYCEFVSALHPNRDPQRRGADADRIQDEVNRQVAQCSCAKRFQVEQISANRYRFGESQQLRMVRILRSTLMVRVGGGWIALDEFLVKNDPCRVKGRTNVKINEKYLSPDAFGAAARCSGNQSAPSSKALSPSRSNSSLSLYSSASAPSSPLARKSVRRRTRSGERCPRARGSLPPDGAELHFPAAEESPDAAPPEPPDGSPPERRSPCR